MKQSLGEFDGKHTQTLESLAEQLTPDAATVRQLCHHAKSADERLQVAATWLLKRFLEAGKRYAPSQTDRILELLDHVTHWEATLHVLQMLPALSVRKDTSDSLRSSIRPLLDHDNKLLRAWSYNAMVVLASHDTTLRPEALDLLHAGEQDPAASVRARIRNLRKTTAWIREQA